MDNNATHPFEPGTIFRRPTYNSERTLAGQTHISFMVLDVSHDRLIRVQVLNGDQAGRILKHINIASLTKCMHDGTHDIM